MFGLFKKKTQLQGQKITFAITDMHCTSCAINIDGALEDTAGVYSANTSYAQAKTVVEYDPSQVKPDQLQKLIADQGYTVEPVASQE
jgi:copper chaperone CopZ